ncbi:type II secretion protein F [Advenella kashmirensis W13003]|uniref:Type II secretion protein F n=1 Tax=Advenella kashmirensis W13003 TaxID=1424334 RepID=V8QQQ0_9BURK|nr:type II secretion system F family protein [Advenella kashmirensis]ETF02296.1 type II secretion protein F [Advenella kashmirensis W13003]
MIVWISCILTGLSFCLCLYLLLSPARRVIATPQAYQQSRALVLLWPWIHGLGRTLLPWMPWTYRTRLLSLLRHAGLERDAQIDHIAGIQGLAGCIVFVCAVVFQRHHVFGDPLLVLFISCVMAAAGSALPLLWLRDRAQKRQDRVLRELPFFLDMTTLCVEAGLNLQGALHQTAELCPPGILRDELRYCLSEMRTGRPRVEALRAMGLRTGVVEVSHWVATIAQAEKMGMGLGPLLRSQSEQRRRERFNRAEKRALEAPVKMLLPLIFCIFPCTFIVLAFPVAMKILQSGL